MNSPSISKIVGDNVKAHRERNRMSPAELASKVGCSRQMIYSIENGSRFPSMDLLMGIAEVLGTEINSLMSGAVRTNFTESPNDLARQKILGARESIKDLDLILHQLLSLDTLELTKSESQVLRLTRESSHFARAIAALAALDEDRLKLAVSFLESGLERSSSGSTSGASGL